MKKCPFCGAELNDDNLFCSECGKELSKGFVCPHCGAVVNEGDAFCENCGKRIDEVPTKAAEPISEKLKCPHCGTAVNEGDAFCENCGKRIDEVPTKAAEPISEKLKCPHCGAAINEGDAFCEKCGKSPFVENVNTNSGEGQQQTYESNNSSSNILIIILAVVLAFLIGGTCYYFYINKKAANQQEAISDNNSDLGVDSLAIEDNDIRSEAFIKQRLVNFCQETFKIEEKGVVNKYFSLEFKKLYNTIEDLESRGKGGDGLWYSGGFFDGSSEGVSKMSVGKIQFNGKDNANADIICSDGNFEYTNTAKLVFENENWYIDDLCNRKSDMREYIDYMENNDNDSEEESEDVVDTHNGLKVNIDDGLSPKDDTRKCWFVYGTKKELSEQGIISSNNVTINSSNIDYLTKADKYVDKEIRLYSKQIQILTPHPTESYQLSKDANGNYILTINDPDSFWIDSKFLVIEVK